MHTLLHAQSLLVVYCRQPPSARVVLVGTFGLTGTIAPASVLDAVAVATPPRRSKCLGGQFAYPAQKTRRSMGYRCHDLQKDRIGAEPLWFFFIFLTPAYAREAS